MKSLKQKYQLELNKLENIFRKIKNNKPNSLLDGKYLKIVGEIIIYKKVIGDLEITQKETTQFIIYDKNEKRICEGDKFTFDFIDNDNVEHTFKGSFCWNDEELRYEVDVYDNNDGYVCLWYDYMKMKNFELIEE